MSNAVEVSSSASNEGAAKPSRSKVVIEDSFLNVVTLVGVLARAPELRFLKSGEQVVNLDVRVKSEEGRIDVLPVSFFEAPESVMKLQVGDAIGVVGRMRRQWFAGRANFTDIVAVRVVPASSKVKLRKALGSAMATLQAAAP